MMATKSEGKGMCCVIKKRGSVSNEREGTTNEFTSFHPRSPELFLSLSLSRVIRTSDEGKKEKERKKLVLRLLVQIYIYIYIAFEFQR